LRGEATVLVSLRIADADADEDEDGYGETRDTP
jgi:hypothetical protein